MGNGLQQVVAEVFEARRKGLTYQAEFRIHQYPDADGELEMLYRRSAHELVLWVLPDWTAVVEARSLQRRQFKKKLYSTEVNLAAKMGIGQQHPAIADVGRGAVGLADAFDRSVTCLTIAADDEEVASGLASIWGEFAA
jgi:hypothetical protein